MPGAPGGATEQRRKRSSESERGQKVGRMMGVRWQKVSQN